MARGLTARVELHIEAPASDVWKALTDPEKIKKYMFGADVTSEWRTGSSVVIKGEWKGKPYEDKGTVIAVDPGRMLEYTHYSPLSGLPDSPENYHTIKIELISRDAETDLVLSQDNNADEDERAHSEQNWKMMMEGMKKVAEETPRGC